MYAFDMLADMVRERRIFQRNKVPLEKKLLAVLMSFAGLSYRKSAQLIGGLSYVAIHKAFMAMKHLPEPEIEHRRCIAIDETKTKLGSRQLFIWAARDVDSKELLAFRCSFTRSSLDAEIFIKYVLRYCTNRPLFLVDHGPWYPYAFEQLGLEYKQQTFGERNSIERWFRNSEEQAQKVLQ